MARLTPPCDSAFGAMALSGRPSTARCDYSWHLPAKRSRHANCNRLHISLLKAGVVSMLFACVTTPAGGYGMAKGRGDGAPAVNGGRRFRDHQRRRAPRRRVDRNRQSHAGDARPRRRGDARGGLRRHPRDRLHSQRHGAQPAGAIDQDGAGAAQRHRRFVLHRHPQFGRGGALRSRLRHGDGRHARRYGTRKPLRPAGALRPGRRRPAVFRPHAGRPLRRARCQRAAASWCATTSPASRCPSSRAPTATPPAPWSSI